MKTDPWIEIGLPESSGAINAKRVDAEHPFNFYWARDLAGLRLLVLEYSGEITSTRKMPALSDMELIRLPGSGSHRLIWRLLKPEHTEVFYRLCADIIFRSSDASTEAEAVELAIGRTWKWRQLLRGGGSGLLTPEAQKGLVGEMKVIEGLLLEILDAGTAIACWKGPEDAPKDFEVGRIAIESKARRGGSTPFVKISSEWQLDTQGVDELYMHVVEVDASPLDNPDAVTVVELANRIARRIAQKDPSAEEQFQSLLVEAGLDLDDDYSDYQWSIGASSWFHVGAGFPRISGGNLDPGVDRVTYSIALNSISDFLVEQAELEQRLEQTNE
ncbi:PD-(D/E)XK motif protein [Hyphomonas sp. GM-8P]|uniref:PD-(D/E)XK motif protein n=1 Tax=Hyphomonas sp. GM-8P TaxID=1280945 RepID=UPI000DBFB366|nr:PD-(D/E)XK motif protein [Hyphomonas sp. GM-8P]RAN38911.1 hypothetical protein HY26_17200 [Hyphomonas sp. GM-8P]